MTEEIHVEGRKLAAVLGTVAQVYTTASEMLGGPINRSQRAKLWGQISDEQALFLIAKILADIDLSTVANRAEVDIRWARGVAEKNLRDRLLVSTHLGSTLFAPQLLLLAVREALADCRPGPPSKDLEGFDLVVRCLLGIGDEASSTRRPDSWGGLPGGLAGEMIANLNFNRAVNIGHQLTWIDRAWFQEWPESNKAVQAVGGQPWELFEEATGVRLGDFAAIAINLFIRASQSVLSPLEYFATLGLPQRATTHFLQAASQTVAQLRAEMNSEAESSQGSLYAFDTLRRFPLVRLRSGDVLTLRAGFLVSRAMSEVTYFDVRAHLLQADRVDGTKRDEAFKSCTNDVLEYEAGATMQRMFARIRRRVIGEKELQKLFSSKAKTASVCDYAVRQGSTWMLIEVTDRAIPRDVAFGQADAEALDKELDLVLTTRKAKQLASTIDLLRGRHERGDLGASRILTFIPLVLTAPAGLGWNTAVHQRVKERLTAKGWSEEMASSVALITLQDLRLLENLAEHGHDVIKVLRSWRESAPGDALDSYLLHQGLPLGPPIWEKRRAMQVVEGFVSRMRNPAQH